MGKIDSSKALLKMAGGGECIPHIPPPLDPPLNQPRALRRDIGLGK